MDLFIGGYTNDDGPRPQGITRFGFDPVSGAIDDRGVALELVSPTWIVANSAGTRLYAVTEGSGGSVVAIAREPDSGALAELNRASSHGDGPCHASLTADERFVLVTNYASGTIAVLPVREDGGLGEAVATAAHVGSSVVAGRQAEAHAHQITQSPDGGSVLVCDLGMDKVVVYAFDQHSGSLSQATTMSLTPGAGPRHLAFAPGGSLVYVINELNSTVVAARWDSSARSLTAFQTISTVPSDFEGTNYPSEILISPDGRFVYGANRLHDSVVVYAVDPTSGALSAVAWVPVGAYPRNIAFGPDARWVMASNQEGGSITLLARDAESGLLEQAGDAVPVQAPAIAVFLS